MNFRKSEIINMLLKNGREIPSMLSIQNGIKHERKEEIT